MASLSRGVRLPPMPRIADIIRLYGLTAKKQLSQNFILDLNVTEKIARKANLFDTYVCEVGSGPGSITRSILQEGVRHVAAVEIDQRFMPVLEQLADCADGYMSVHNEDIRKFNIAKALSKANAVPWESEELPGVRLVGNLPFSVSIPLLLQWLEAIPERKGPFTFGRVPMTLVFQKEVAENLAAIGATMLQSRLSVMTQNLCSVQRAMVMPRSMFVPEPKVDAWLVNIVPHKEAKIKAPFKIVEQVVKAVYQHRRKYIRTPLRLLFPEAEKLADDLTELSGVTATKRAHQLTMEDFDALCQTFLELCNKHGLSNFPLKVHRPSPIVHSSVANA
ncbi:dimethyladenosine transferase 1, mitochondrial-like [Rhopilema esculentum]|uniref:dimethyladenosine transferase 1, mitochondrial-like n=1 Tax=Rhopilema esculentum TaxID=499914 RepID=UPI0031DA6244|eukprot:gene17466-9074_t